MLPTHTELQGFLLYLTNVQGFLLYLTNTFRIYQYHNYNMGGGQVVTPVPVVPVLVSMDEER